MYKPRDYQQEIFSLLLGTNTNDLVQLDTGAGKTLIIAMLCEAIKERIIVVAHRRLLISQLKKNLGKNIEVMTPHAANIRKTDVSDAVVIIDEAHHVIEKNIWGKMAKQAKRCIGFTATPWRLDGVPLSQCFDRLVQSNTLKSGSVWTLIEKGILSPFTVYSLPYYAQCLKLGRNDYTKASLVADANTQFNSIAGSVIREYQKRAAGTQAVCFCTTIDLAKKQAEKFNEANISAVAISSKHSNADNNYNVERFKERSIRVICHVDMFGEGIDIPGIESIIMTRKTASLALYRQWIGRALRGFDNKEKAIIIDHVGNALAHGLPTKEITWSLDYYENQHQYLKKCKGCEALIPAFSPVCPECGQCVMTAGSFKTFAQNEMSEIALEQMIEEKEREKEALNARDDLKKTQIQTHSLDGAPPLVKVMREQVVPDFVEMMKAKGKSIESINKVLQSVSLASEWAKWFAGFDFSKAEVFYDKYSK